MLKPGDDVHTVGNNDDTPPVRGRVREVRRYAFSGHNVTEEVYVAWRVPNKTWPDDDERR
jgi:hypothetical protein